MQSIFFASERARIFRGVNLPYGNQSELKKRKANAAVIHFLFFTLHDLSKCVETIKLNDAHDAAGKLSINGCRQPLDFLPQAWYNKYITLKE